MRHKITISALISAVFLSFLFPFASASDNPYSDVRENSWYYDAVMYVTEKGIMTETENGKFSPKTLVKRGDFILALSRLQPEAFGEMTYVFSDVPDDADYAAAILWAVRHGIASGIGNGKFGFEDDITREQLAVFIARYLEEYPVDFGVKPAFKRVYSDESKISRWAAPSVERLTALGVLEGDEKGDFRPKATVTRAELAALLMRIDTGTALNVPTAAETLSFEREVIHAAGVATNPATGKQYLHTNAYEALVQNYEAGSRIFEIDFSFSSDNRLACVHDWSTRFFPKNESGEPLTYAEYVKTSIYGHFRHITPDELADFMREHRDLYVVTDIKDRNLDGARVLAESYPDLTGRFIIQIYAKDEYEPIRKLGFKNIILTLYQMSYEERVDAEALVSFAKSHELVAFTFPANFTEREGYVTAMKKAGIPLLVHTVNGAKLKETYYKAGIDGVYTDYSRYYDDAPESIR